jgi:hypothetical protein
VDPRIAVGSTDRGYQRLVFFLSGEAMSRKGQPREVLAIKSVLRDIASSQLDPFGHSQSGERPDRIGCDSDFFETLLSPTTAQMSNAAAA